MLLAPQEYLYAPNTRVDEAKDVSLLVRKTFMCRKNVAFANEPTKMVLEQFQLHQIERKKLTHY